ncbi:hypothetical protein ACPRNU_24950, partial [Chromobacterium vaccinii]|uniref:hypothetical protein n=1 Tax=Chromobacterium vaccinii TaxID=1108595 RepID=UPI003C749FDA
RTIPATPGDVNTFREKNLKKLGTPTRQEHKHLILQKIGQRHCNFIVHEQRCRLAAMPRIPACRYARPVDSATLTCIWHNDVPAVWTH